MQKILFFFLISSIAYLKSSGQTNSTDKELMDSLLKNDEMLKMINNIGKASSYFRINVGIGNNLYSNQNKEVETLQNNTPIVFTPSASYYHKSGFGISFAAFLFNENKKTNFHQYTATPSFNYTKGKVADINISYTHYFLKDNSGTNTSPIQNELYGTFLFKKTWIKPGVAIGYSTGKINEVVKIDTTFKVLNRQVQIKYIDTAKIQLSSLSIAATVEHEFIFYNLFSSKDGLIFTPQLSVISGINDYKINHSSSLENYNSFTKKQIKRIRHFQSQSDNNKYDLQSFGFDLDANYAIGKFYIEPEVYFNYHLPNTPDNHFTQIYSLNIGITF